LHWSNIGQDLVGTTIESVVPTALTDPTTNQQVVLAAGWSDLAFGGLSRSTDGGNTFQPVLLAGSNQPIFGVATDLVADPTNKYAFYAAMPHLGVLGSLDGGIHWTNISNGNQQITQADSLKLAISNSTVLYVATATAVNKPGYQEQVTAVFRTSVGLNLSVNWTAIGPNSFPAFLPVDIANGHFAMTADPTDANVVYVSGYESNIWRGDAKANTWTNIYTTNNSSPHADSRHLAFLTALGTSVLLETDDGGIYALTNPLNPGPLDRWVSLNASLSDTETYGTAYDPLNQVALAGMQDVGSADGQPLAALWREELGGDGGFRQDTTFSVLGISFSFRYSEEQNLDKLRLQVFDSSDKLLFTSDRQMAVNGTPDTIVSLESHLPKSTITAETPFMVNAVDDRRMLVATNYLYESFDRASSFNSVGGLLMNQGSFIPANPLGSPEADSNSLYNPIVYGGWITSRGAAGTPPQRTGNPDLIWLGAGGKLWLRTVGQGLPQQVAAYPGAAVRSIVVDPNDWNYAYVFDNNGRVWQTKDAGGHWQELTANLGSVCSDVRTLEIYNPNAGLPGTGVLLAGGRGGVFRLLQTLSGSNWSLYGDQENLTTIPHLAHVQIPNVLVTSVHYDPTDDVLIAGTFGRGVWQVSNASATLQVPESISVFGDNDYANENDNFRISIDPNNATRVLITLNGVEAADPRLASLAGIRIYGQGGNNTLTVDESHGLVPLPIFYDGGSGSNRLIVDDSKNAVAENVTVYSGQSLTVGPTSITYLDTAATEIDTGYGGDTVAVPSTSDALTIKSGGFDTINVGDATDMHNIVGTITLQDAKNLIPALDQVNLNDSFDGQIHNNVVVTSASVTGLAAAISFPNLAVILVVSTGTAGDVVNVQSTQAPYPMQTGPTVYVNSGGPDQVNVGQSIGGLTSILGQLSVRNFSATFTSVTLDDTGDSLNTRNAKLTSGSLGGLGGAEIDFGPHVGMLVIKGGVFSTDTFVVQSLPTFTELTGGKNSTTTLQGPDTNNTWKIVDAGTGTLNSNLIFGNVQNLVGGQDDDAFLFSNAGSLAGSLDGGAGNNSLNYGAYGLPVTVTLGHDAALTGVQGQASGIAGGFTNIDSLTGGLFASTLDGSSFAGSFANQLSVIGFGAMDLNVPGDFSGALLAASEGTAAVPVQYISIGGSLADGAKIKVNFLTTLTVGADLAGTFKGFGVDQQAPTLKTLTVVGNVTITGAVISAGAIQIEQIGGNVAGLLEEDTPPGVDVRQLIIGGTLTDSGVIRAGSIGLLAIGGDLAGQVSVSGPIGVMLVFGNLSGSLAASTILVAFIDGDLAGQLLVSGNLDNFLVLGNISGTVSAGWMHSRHGKGQLLHYLRGAR
jgi:hypothetical protein